MSIIKVFCCLIKPSFAQADSMVGKETAAFIYLYKKVQIAFSIFISFHHQLKFSSKTKMKRTLRGQSIHRKRPGVPAGLTVSSLCRTPITRLQLCNARLHNFLPQRTLDGRSNIPQHDCTRQRAILGMRPNKFSTKSEGREEKEKSKKKKSHPSFKRKVSS